MMYAKRRVAWLCALLVGVTACGGGENPPPQSSRGGNGAGAAGAGGAGAGTSGSGTGGADSAFGNVDMSVPQAKDVLKPPMPNADAFWAKDPPRMMCLEDGSKGPPPVAPGGTVECPSDKNREGCGCGTIGETAACWPGLRANRNRGICRDGMTKCMEHGEFGGVWGACEGFVPPVQGVVSGPSGCGCFSQGTWKIDNISPCFISFSDTSIYAVSTAVGPDGNAACPADPGGPPPVPEPGTVWSTDRLQVDCEGQFELCYTLKAGKREAPLPGDCVVARVCVETWYEKSGVEQELPDLPAWASNNPACASMFQTVGGYGEMTVKGLSLECEAVDDGSGNEYVFNRMGYCPASCNATPDAAECKMCQMGGSGNF